MRKIGTLVPTPSLMVLMVGLLTLCFSSCERTLPQPVIDAITPSETPSVNSGIPFEVTDATFDDLVLGSELPIVVEFKDDN